VKDVGGASCVNVTSEKLTSPVHRIACADCRPVGEYGPRRDGRVLQLEAENVWQLTRKAHDMPYERVGRSKKRIERATCERMEYCSVSKMDESHHAKIAMITPTFPASKIVNSMPIDAQLSRSRYLWHNHHEPIMRSKVYIRDLCRPSYSEAKVRAAKQIKRRCCTAVSLTMTLEGPKHISVFGVFGRIPASLLIPRCHKILPPHFDVFPLFTVLLCHWRYMT